MSDIAFSVLVGNGFDDIIFKTIMIKGDKGNSIASIEKTSTSGLVDTYTITLTDGTVGGTFTVTNGSPINLDDDDIALDKTWSSSKLSEMIGEGINDEDEGDDILWSSLKIQDEIMAVPLPRTYELDNVAIPAIFPDGADNVPVSELIVDIEAVQDGTGDASPTNVRAIHGWDTLHLVKCGTNIWDEQWERGAYNATGEKSTNASYIRSKFQIPVKPNCSYYLKTPTVNGRVCFYDKNGNFISRSDSLGNAEFTTPANCFFITFFTLESEDYQNNISINFPSADTDYNAYNGGIDTIDLTETVYGGTLNVSTGLLTVTKKYINLGDCEWAMNITNYMTARAVPTDAPLFVDNNTNLSLCSAYKAVAVNGATQSSDLYIYISSGGQIRIKDTAKNELTASQFKTAMDGIYYAYPLATQTTIQLTPTQVRTLLGQNQIYADTGNINKIVYFKTGSETVARMIEAYMRS